MKRDNLERDLRIDADGVLRGFVVDPADLTMRFAVDVVADSLTIALLRAQNFRPDLTIGDGCYGFELHLSDGIRARARRIEARLANSGSIIGHLTDLGASSRIVDPAISRGRVRWAGGLRLSGWLPGSRDTPPQSVKALIDGQEVASTPCLSWTHVEDGGGARIARAFELFLPRDFADGRVRSVDVVSDEGVEIVGSPCHVFALTDGFQGVIDAYAELESERVRAQFADGILPQSVPFSAYPAWLARFAVTVPSTSLDKIAVVIVGEEGLDVTLASLEAQKDFDWSASVLPTTTSSIAFDPAQFRTFLREEGQECDLIVATLSGAKFAPYALARFVAAARECPSATALYGDIAIEAEGQALLLGFPAFDGELFLEQAYCGLCYALRPSAVAVDVVNLFDLFPMPDPSVSASSAAMPVHLPTVLAALPSLPGTALLQPLMDSTVRRLARWRVRAEVTPSGDPNGVSVRVRRKMNGRRISVIIPDDNDGEALEATLNALRQETAGGSLQLIIADSTSVDPTTVAALQTFQRAGGIISRRDGWHSEPQSLNQAAALADGDLLLFLRPGVIAAGATWLDELLSRLADDAVGAVGPLVAWPGGVVRDAGWTLGPRMSASARFTDRHIDDSGYAGWLRAAHQVSALSAICMMTPRRHFQNLDGFDAARFSTRYFDLDYCLRLRERGLKIVLTPHARVILATQPTIAMDESMLPPIVAREKQALRDRWRLAPGCDPFYSPWMAMDGVPYSGLAWPPVPFAERQPQAAKARRLPSLS